MNLLCFFGHHRSASSWTHGILHNLSKSVGWHYALVHNSAMFNHNLPQFYRQNKPDFFTFSNAKQQYLADLPTFMGLHLVRDPRDVLISAYFSHRNSHPTTQWPELVKHRAELQALSEPEGFLLELECRREQFEDMATWQYNAPNIYELKMEQLTQNPAYHFKKLFLFWNCLGESKNEKSERLQCKINKLLWHLEYRLGGKINLPHWKSDLIWPWLLQEILETNTFRHKSGGRTLGEQDIHHHYRMGIAGSWRNYFFPELTRQFKANYNDLLVQLGYETSGDW